MKIDYFDPKKVKKWSLFTPPFFVPKLDPNLDPIWPQFDPLFWGVKGGVFCPPFLGGSGDPPPPPPKNRVFGGSKRALGSYTSIVGKKGGQKGGQKRPQKRTFCPKRGFGSTFSWYSTHLRVIFGPYKKPFYLVNLPETGSKKSIFWPFPNYSTFPTRFFDPSKTDLGTLRFQTGPGGGQFWGYFGPPKRGSFLTPFFDLKKGSFLTPFLTQKVIFLSTFCSFINFDTKMVKKTTFWSKKRNLSRNRLFWLKVVKKTTFWSKKQHFLPNRLFRLKIVKKTTFGPKIDVYRKIRKHSKPMVLTPSNRGQNHTIWHVVLTHISVVLLRKTTLK